jgi:uncharacterized membrane protein
MEKSSGLRNLVNLLTRSNKSIIAQVVRFGLWFSGKERVVEMTHIKRSIEINAPVEKVFQYAADWQNWPKFFVGVYEFQPTTEITRGSGARYAYKAEMLGMKAPVETEIQDFVENEGWTGIATKGVKHKTQWLFEPIEGGTKFTYGVSYQMPVPLIGGILDKLFMKPAWVKIVEDSLQNLKEQTE